MAGSTYGLLCLLVLQSGSCLTCCISKRNEKMRIHGNVSFFYLAYHPKTGFLQSQIKRLPMLYDDEFMNERSTSEASDNCSLEELAMPWVSRVMCLYLSIFLVCLNICSNLFLRKLTGNLLNSPNIMFYAYSKQNFNDSCVVLNTLPPCFVVFFFHSNENDS